jgi:hypothetical protein
MDWLRNGMIDSRPVLDFILSLSSRLPAFASLGGGVEWTRGQKEETGEGERNEQGGDEIEGPDCDLLVIQEGSVLLRIQHLEQSTRWISVMPLSNLVDFIDQNQRVLGCNLLQRLNRFTRHSTIISSVLPRTKQLTQHRSFDDL